MKFEKLQSLGNDFLVLVNPVEHPSAALIKRLGDRRVGVGFDQLLVIEEIATAHWRYSIYNQDGSEAEQCLNGARSVGYLLYKQQGIKKLTLTTVSEDLLVSVMPDERIQVMLKWPSLIERVPEGWFYSVGNPHWVIDLTGRPWTKTAIQERYQQRPVNVSGVYRHAPNRISLCTYERGVGFTHACGSACVATFAALYDNGLCEPALTILQKGGMASMTKHNQSVTFEGVASWVYSGELVSAEQILYQGASRQNREHGYKEIL